MTSVTEYLKLLQIIFIHIIWSTVYRNSPWNMLNTSRVWHLSFTAYL